MVKQTYISLQKKKLEHKDVTTTKSYLKKKQLIPQPTNNNPMI
ncbi:unnamed protein product, partial [Vitis vinifera]|uniref:Uncharacterized protein n=1 Tax=Vitis vinifera TaxID=29760 RepID=D7T446_VITVI